MCCNWGLSSRTAFDLLRTHQTQWFDLVVRCGPLLTTNLVALLLTSKVWVWSFSWYLEENLTFQDNLYWTHSAPLVNHHPKRYSWMRMGLFFFFRHFLAISFWDPRHLLNGVSCMTNPHMSWRCTTQMPGKWYAVLLSFCARMSLLTFQIEEMRLEARFTNQRFTESNDLVSVAFVYPERSSMSQEGLVGCATPSYLYSPWRRLPNKTLHPGFWFLWWMRANNLLKKSWFHPSSALVSWVARLCSSNPQVVLVIFLFIVSFVLASMWNNRVESKKREVELTERLLFQVSIGVDKC